MEHTFKIEKELKITTENIVDCVLSCEAGGFDYWGELCSDEKDYEAARQRLAEREKADMKPCYEDVLAEILESGGKLTVYDREDDKDHELTLEKLLNGWKKYAEDHRRIKQRHGPEVAFISVSGNSTTGRSSISGSWQRVKRPLSLAAPLAIDRRRSSCMMSKSWFPSSAIIWTPKRTI